MHKELLRQKDSFRVTHIQSEDEGMRIRRIRIDETEYKYARRVSFGFVEAAYRSQCLQEAGIAPLVTRGSLNSYVNHLAFA